MHQDSYSATSLIPSHMQTENTLDRSITPLELTRWYNAQTKRTWQRKRKPSSDICQTNMHNNSLAESRACCIIHALSGLNKTAAPLWSGSYQAVIRQLSQERRGQRRITVPHCKTYALIRASVKRGYSSSVNENRKGIPEHAGTRTYRRRASEGRLGIQGYKTNTKR